MSKKVEADAERAFSVDADLKDGNAMTTEIVPNDGVADDLSDEFDFAALFIRFFGEAIPIELDDSLSALVREVQATLSRNSVPWPVESPLLITDKYLFYMRSALQTPIEGLSSGEEQRGIL